MDGLSTLSEEEQESAKAQTEDNQQQTKLLQSNINRYFHISTNEKQQKLYHSWCAGFTASSWLREASGLFLFNHCDGLSVLAKG